MNKRKTVFIALGSVALIFALLIGSYVIRQNQYQEMLAVPAMENNKDIIETDALLSAEYDTMSDNPIKEISDIEQDNDLGQYGELASKLSQEYEDAMANSDLEAFEIELIRSMVEKENKTFEQALQAVRPGSKVIQEQTQTVSNSPNTQPATTTKPSGNDTSSAGVNNSDNKTEAQKKAEEEKKMEEDFFKKWSGGYEGGAGGDTSHEPNFGLPDNRTNQQKKADEDAGNAFGGGYEGGPGGDTSHEPDFGLPDNRTDQQKKADEDAFEDWSGGLVGGPGGDVSHEPDF